VELRYGINPHGLRLRRDLDNAQLSAALRGDTMGGALPERVVEDLLLDNCQIRFIKGDLTHDEKQRLAQTLSEPVEELTTAKRARWLRALDGVAFTSDGALPFRDNVDHAHRHGVSVHRRGGRIQQGLG
jgi:hypothetical protein